MRARMFFFTAALISLLCPACPAETDISASLYGAFNQSNSGNGTQQTPADAAGTLLEFRHISNPLVGYEVSYAYNRANQAYGTAIPPGSVSCGSPCSQSVFSSVSANAHEITGNWVVSIKVASLHPFAIAGGGLLFNVPASGKATTTTCYLLNPLCMQSTAAAMLTSTSTQAVFVYGGGVDWRFLPHLGLRLQYRGNFSKAPTLVDFEPTGVFTHTSEPMIGVYFRL